MNIEDIRAERLKAEAAVLAALEEFKVKTGLSIVGCKVGVTFETHQVDDRHACGHFVADVKLEVEPL